MSAARQQTHNNSQRIKVEPPDLYNPNTAVQKFKNCCSQLFNEPQNVFGLQQQVKLEPQNYDEHNYDNSLQQNRVQNNNG